MIENNFSEFTFFNARIITIIIIKNKKITATHQNLWVFLGGLKESLTIKFMGRFKVIFEKKRILKNNNKND